MAQLSGLEKTRERSRVISRDPGLETHLQVRIEDIVHSLEYIERMSHVPIFARRNEAEVWLKQHMYEDILNCFWIEIARLERMQKQVYNGF